MLRHMRNHVKSIMITVIVLFVVSCFAGYGLYSRSGNKASNGSMQDYPVAEVDGKKVMRSQIENNLGRIAEQYGQQDISSKDLPVLRKAVLDSIVIEAEVEKEIKTRSIKVTNDEIDAAYVKIMDGYPTREEFMANLERTGTTEKAVKADIEKQLAQEKLMESVNSGIEVTDKEAHAFYDTAKNFLYKQPAGVMTNIATFKSKKAAELAQKAIAGGAAWDKIMEEHKADIESSTPYDKPVLMTEQMFTQSPALAKLKTLELNKLSPVTVIEGEHAYIAIKRSKAAEKTLSYAEVSADVMNAIKGQKSQEKQNEFYQTLLSRATVKILDAQIFPEVKADAAETKSADKN